MKRIFISLLSFLCLMLYMAPVYAASLEDPQTTQTLIIQLEKDQLETHPFQIALDAQYVLDPVQAPFLQESWDATVQGSLALWQAIVEFFRPHFWWFAVVPGLGQGLMDGDWLKSAQIFGAFIFFAAFAALGAWQLIDAYSLDPENLGVWPLFTGLFGAPAVTIWGWNMFNAFDMSRKHKHAEAGGQPFAFRQPPTVGAQFRQVVYRF